MRFTKKNAAPNAKPTRTDDQTRLPTSPMSASTTAGNAIGHQLSAGKAVVSTTPLTTEVSTAAHSGTIGRGAAARGTRQSYAGLRTAPARRPRRQRGSDRAVCHDAAADRIERLARGRGKRSVSDERELIEQVDRLLRPADEIARSHVGLDQHPLQRHSTRPRVHGLRETTGDRLGPGQVMFPLEVVKTLPEAFGRRQSGAERSARQSPFTRSGVVTPRFVHQAARERREGRGIQIPPDSGP